MRTQLVAFVLILGFADSAALNAQATVPTDLWRGFSTASTKAQIKAFKQAQANRRVEVYPGCMAEMGYRHVKNKLVTIIFLGQDRDKDCFVQMYANLLREHGEPEMKGASFGSVIGYGTGSAVSSIDTTSAGAINIWRRGEKKIKLIKTPGNGYNLIFTVRPDKYIY